MGGGGGRWGGGRGRGHGGCEQRIEVFVKIQKKKIFFWGGGRSGGGGGGGGGGVGGSDGGVGFTVDNQNGSFRRKYAFPVPLGGRNGSSQRKVIFLAEGVFKGKVLFAISRI